ncbi:MAG: hypothetical protein ACI9WO_000849, partial [Sphingobacteriales bacterium]
MGIKIVGTNPDYFYRFPNLIFKHEKLLLTPLYTGRIKIRFPFISEKFGHKNSRNES